MSICTEGRIYKIVPRKGTKTILSTYYCHINYAFIKLFPVRGRKLHPCCQHYSKLQIYKIVPRKGTKTYLSPSIVLHSLIYKIVPRKGTKTFLTLLLISLLIKIYKIVPRKGTKTSQHQQLFHLRSLFIKLFPVRGRKPVTSFAT